MKQVGVLDVGSGNIPNMVRALEHVGCRVSVVADAQSARQYDRLVLPGVGHYDSVLQGIDGPGFRQVILEKIHAGAHFLGVCVGLQVLGQGSDESQQSGGLDLVPARVEAMQQNVRSGAKVPHMGWNSIATEHGDPLLGSYDKASFYFVHSFAFAASSDPWCVARTQYGDWEFCAAVRVGDQAWATQFHPEKSGDMGLSLLRDFAAL